ncbi:hypothetical protein A3709_20100 [Halioglobus sp. HI00S01]|uniref:PilW family protein n=1 Tax=Halioglobus sp. HI00S01 TaxID=1822214 RepID=UPI0007C37407|nr:PilW family protein [Halioglobus sp. HI00S01]KZX57929.1 hypothetical protein A3709_20100 [Halioglobus sp. HI00S01]
MIDHFAVTVRRQQGLTLLETMVALALTAFLLLGAVQIFLATKTSSVSESSLAKLQENGRLAIELLSADIRRANYSGCNSIDGLVEIVATGVQFNGVRGFSRAASDSSWTPTPSGSDLTEASTNGRAGSDMLNIQMATTLGKNILDGELGSSDDDVTITANPECAVGQNDLVIVSSCLSAHMFRVTNAITCTDPTSDVTLEFADSGNLPIPVEPGYRYGEPSELMKYENVAWYVADTGRDIAGSDVFALYRSVGGVAEELVEGVEYLRLEYGERVGDQVRYVAASDPSINWENVTTLRMAFLLQGYELVRTDPDIESYILLSDTIPATGTGAHSGGAFLRKVFTTTATLRNTRYETL